MSMRFFWVACVFGLFVAVFGLVTRNWSTPLPWRTLQISPSPSPSPFGNLHRSIASESPAPEHLPLTASIPATEHLQLTSVGN
jgi:hypothetical protein